MNLREKQIFAYYLKNILVSECQPEDTDSFLSFVWRYSDDIFGVNMRPLIRKRKMQSFHDHEDSDLSELEQMRLLRGMVNGEFINCGLVSDEAEIARIENIVRQNKIDMFDIDITQRDFDKSFTVICDAFDIDEKSRPLLQYFMYATKISALHRMTNLFNDRFNDGLMHNDNVDVMSGFTKISLEDIKQIISINGPLMDKGILSARYGDRGFSGMFNKLIGTYFESVREVQNFLVGNPFESDLNRENFDYIAKDYDIISNILKNAKEKNQKGVNILLYGHPGCGKTELAKSVCVAQHLDLYTTPENKESKEERLSGLCQVQTILKKSENGVILFDEAEDVFSLNPFSSHTPSKLFLNRRLEQNTTPVIWITNNVQYMDPAYIRRFTISIEVQDPDIKAKTVAWKRVFDKHGVEISDEKLEKIVKKYDVPIALVDTAVRNVKLLDDPDMLEYTIDNLVKAATGVKPTDKKKQDEVKFETSLLNTDVDLKNLADKIKEKNLKSFSLCLYGAPGTGKSAYAKFLAEMLDMPIISKKASDIKSMWVGGTEKNIARAFAEAREKKALLIFDEADSFLADRRGANASWEVSCVNEMLTQMENAEYPFVCTTNLMSGLDKASLRRFSFKVKYEYMTTAQVKSACNLFLGIDVSENEIAEYNKLAPGDFAVVKKQASLLEITDKAELLKMLKTEQDTKDMTASGNVKTKIGF